MNQFMNRCLIVTFSLFFSSLSSHAHLTCLEIDGLNTSETPISLRIENIPDLAHFDLTALPEIKEFNTISTIKLGKMTHEPLYVLAQFQETNHKVLNSLQWVYMAGLHAESPEVLALFHHLNKKLSRYDFSVSEEGISLQFSPLDMSFTLTDCKEENYPDLCREGFH